MRFISTRYALPIVLGVALVIRVSAALYLGNEVKGPSGAQDEVSYSMLGQRLAGGYGLTFPSGWYPWIQADAPQSYYSATMSGYLAAIYLLFGYHPLIARLITGLLSTAVVGLVWLLSRKLFDDMVAFWAGLIAAGYAYLVFYGVTLVTETPFMLALLGSIYLACRVVERPSGWHWLALGATLAVTVLLRMAVLFFVPVLLVWIVSRLHRQRLLVLVPAVVIICSLLPFTVRNYLLWNRFLVLESQFGHVFWNGNHPNHQGDFHPFRVFPIPAEVLASHNDAEITNRLLRTGIENILRDPGHFLLLTVTRLRELFKFWPTPESTLLANLMRVGSFAIILPFSVIGLVLSLRQWRSLLPVLLFLVIHTAVYAISWTMIRYRVPMDAFFIMFASYAGVLLVRILRRPIGRATSQTSVPEGRI